VQRKALLAITVAGVLVVTGAVIYSYLAPDPPLPPEYRWGREGALAIDISLDRSELPVNATLDYTLILTNIGERPVRLFIKYFGMGCELLDENNATPEYFGPFKGAPPMRLDDSTFNSMMQVLEPGQNITQSGNFANHTVAGGHFDLWPGMTYHLVGYYSCHEERPYPALPHWLGEVRSEAKYFTVKE
jgi:hypothetical protein